MEKISILILTKNSERMIGRCLEAVKDLSDDIVVLDSMSTDQTTKICKKYTNRVYSLDDKGGTITGGNLRNLVIAKAKHEWIFILDSDEIVSPELKKEIKEVLENGTEYNGFYVKRKDYVFLNTPITITKILRIYKKSKGKFKHIIHESVDVEGKTATFNGILYHYSFVDVSDYFTRFNRYTGIEAKTLYKQNPNIGNFKIILNASLRVPFEFLIWYFGKGLWKAGMVGFFCSCSSGFYQLIKYMKYYELKHQKKRL